ncbi:MAG: MFS transporter [Pseudomonadota bacterium]
MLFTQEQKKTILLTSLGGALEFYDFIVFVFFAKTLGTLFFPSSDSFVSLMASWSLFAVGYLMRPLGGIILGHLGDRIGRKKTFLITLIGMAMPSLLIGLLPVYQTIGILAPVLLILFRLLQGFCVGGEIPGALVFITELTPTQNRALVCSLIFFGVNSGLLLGSVIAALLSHFMAPKVLLTWGWRLPFCLGGVLGILGVYLRRQLHETPLFLQLQKLKKQSSFPLKEILSKYSVQVGQGALLTSLGAVTVSLFFLFMPNYLSTFFHYPFDSLMGLNSILIFTCSLFSILISYYADQHGYLKLFRFGALGLLLFSYPLYALFAWKSFYWVVLATLLLTGMGSLVISVFTSILVGLYPTSVRYTGVALVYNLGFAIAGGFTPLLVTWFIQVTGNRFVPSVYLMGFSGFAFLVSLFMYETRGVALGCRS